jgi:hypothetical protein
MLSLLLFLNAYAWTEGPCTAHFYEDLRPLKEKMDYNPGWCGTRYTMLNLARITAVHGITADGCNKCLQVQNARGGPSIFVWATDRKEAPGLDISRESFQRMTPGSNVLDPQVCRWQVVPNERCGRICFGSSEECTSGVRNSLPAPLLPSMPPAPFGFESVPSSETTTQNVTAPIVSTSLSPIPSTSTDAPRTTSTAISVTSSYFSSRTEEKTTKSQVTKTVVESTPTYHVASYGVDTSSSIRLESPYYFIVMLIL